MRKFCDIIRTPYNRVEKHPLAYVHDRLGECLFVPTRHYHVGDDALQTGDGYVFDGKEWVNKYDRPDWDHHIYSANTTLEAGISTKDWLSTFKAMRKLWLQKRIHDLKHPSEVELEFYAQHPEADKARRNRIIVLHLFPQKYAPRRYGKAFSSRLVLLSLPR